MCLWYIRMVSIFNGAQGNPGGDESFAKGQYCIYTDRSGSADMDLPEVLSPPFTTQKSSFRWDIRRRVPAQHLSPISLSSVSKSTRILGPRIKTYPPDWLLHAHEVVLNSPKVHSQKQKDSATNFFNVWRQMSCRFFSCGHCESESVKTNKLSLFQLRSLWKWKCEDEWVVAFSAPVIVKVWRQMSCKQQRNGSRRAGTNLWRRREVDEWPGGQSVSKLLSFHNLYIAKDCSWGAWVLGR